LKQNTPQVYVQKNCKFTTFEKIPLSSETKTGSMFKIYIVYFLFTKCPQKKKNFVLYINEHNEIYKSSVQNLKKISNIEKSSRNLADVEIHRISMLYFR